MCRKMKLIAVLLKLLCCFYHGIQSNKTCSFVHNNAFEVKLKIYRFQAWALKRPTECITVYSIHVICPHFENFAPIFVPEQNGLEGVVEIKFMPFIQCGNHDCETFYRLYLQVQPVAGVSGISFISSFIIFEGLLTHPVQITTVFVQIYSFILPCAYHIPLQSILIVKVLINVYKNLFSIKFSN